MTRATNAGAQGNAGVFATCRRGGLTHEEIREIEAHRAKDRPTPWQALAIRYGRSEIEIRALFQTKPANDVAPAWPLGACDAPVRSLIETVCRQHGVTPKSLRPNPANGQREGVSNMRAFSPNKVDATDFDTPAGTREYIPGPREPSPYTFSMHYEQGDAAQEAMFTSMATNAPLPFRVTFGSGAQAKQISFNAVPNLTLSAPVDGMDADVVKRGAEAQQQFETLSRVIDVQLKTAFIDLAPAIIKAIELVAKLAQDLNAALDQWRRLDERTGRGLQSERAKLVAERDAIAGQFGTRPLSGQVVVARRIEGENYSTVSGRAAVAAGARPLGGSVPRLPSASNDNWGLFERRGKASYTDAGEQFDAAQRRIAAIDAELASRTVTNQAPQRQDRPGGTSLQLPPGRTSNTGQREAEREARRAERVEQEIFRARQRALGIFDREALTVQERFDIEQAQVKLEREAEQKQLESRLARKDITAKEYEQLKLLNDQTATLEDRVAADILARDLADERLAQERMLSDLTADLLSLQSGAARTAKERRDIELRLLAMAQQRARDERENDPKFRQLSPQRQQAIRDEQERVFGLQRDAVNRANLSPLDAWRDQSLKSIAEVREAYESVAARGLDALNAGIVDAIMNTRSLGDVFGAVAKQILADLLSISVRQSIVEPLAAALFGGGSSRAIAPSGDTGSGGGWLKKALGWGRSLLGFADGRVGGDGKIQGPGTSRSDSILALLDGDPIRVSRDESIMNAEATRKYAPFLRAMNDGVFERYLDGLRGFKDGLVGLSMPSLAMPAFGGAGGVPRPQRVQHEVIVRPERDSFISLASDAAAPVAAQAAMGAVKVVQHQVESQQRRSRQRLA